MEALSKAELRRVLGVARSQRERDYLWILVAYWHGLRISEVLGLMRVNFSGALLTVQRLKGSNKTTQPLVYDDDPLFSEVPALLDYFNDMHGNQKLFPISVRQAERLFVKYCALAGIERVRSHPHVLKHSIALHSIDNAKVHMVQQYLGHKSGSSTLQYLKVTDAEASASVQRAAQGPAKL